MLPLLLQVVSRHLGRGPESKRLLKQLDAVPAWRLADVVAAALATTEQACRGPGRGAGRGRAGAGHGRGQGAGQGRGMGQ